jgi:hypothetical protein
MMRDRLVVLLQRLFVLIDKAFDLLKNQFAFEVQTKDMI